MLPYPFSLAGTATIFAGCMNLSPLLAPEAAGVSERLPGDWITVGPSPPLRFLLPDLSRLGARRRGEGLEAAFLSLSDSWLRLDLECLRCSGPASLEAFPEELRLRRPQWISMTSTSSLVVGAARGRYDRLEILHRRYRNPTPDLNLISGLLCGRHSSLPPFVFDSD